MSDIVQLAFHIKPWAYLHQLHENTILTQYLLSVIDVNGAIEQDHMNEPSKLNTDVSKFTLSRPTTNISFQLNDSGETEVQIYYQHQEDYISSDTQNALESRTEEKTQHVL